MFTFEAPEPQLLQRFAFSFLTSVTGSRRNTSDGQPAQCHTIKDCAVGEYCIQQRCTYSLTSYHDAYGTGLEYNEATGLVRVIDPSKGTWTEST